MTRQEVSTRTESLLLRGDLAARCAGVRLAKAPPELWLIGLTEKKACAC
jgi:hypothetical protein